MPTAALAALLSVPAVRGRGLARLVQGLTEGDPVAWTILGAVVVIGGIVLVVKARRG